MNHGLTLFLCRSAIFTAMVFLATYLPHIPIPLGYAHLGDAVIFLLALTMGKKETILAACLGSALSDLLSGFPIWCLPTILIKWGMVLFVWQFARKKAATTAHALIGMLASSLWMAVGYTLFGALLYASLVAGLGSFPGLAMEGIVNTAIALVVWKPLKARL